MEYGLSLSKEILAAVLITPGNPADTFIANGLLRKMYLSMLITDVTSQEKLVSIGTGQVHRLDKYQLGIANWFILFIP